jgi:hypothetical protein
MKLNPKLNNSLLLVVILFEFLQACSNNSNKKDVDVYLPQLQTLKLDSISFQKYYADENFKEPYSIYIRIKINDSTNLKIINLLKLKNKSVFPTTYLNNLNDALEKQYYFKIKSINAQRYNSLLQKEENLTWWPKPENVVENNIFVRGYLDDKNGKNLVDIDAHKNGRLVYYHDNNYCYILIDCWG